MRKNKFFNMIFLAILFCTSFESMASLGNAGHVEDVAPPPSDQFRPAGTEVFSPFNAFLDFDDDHEICPGNEATYGTQANTAGINTVEWMSSGGGMILEGENARNVKVLWETPGVYTLSFEVTNIMSGNTSSNSLEVTVLESPEVEIRRFAMNPFDEVCLGEEARFLASASASGPPAVQTYDWSYTGGPALTDYGQVAADGSTYRNQGATYTAAGTETVDLTVTYTNGCEQVAPTHSVEAIELPMDPVADQQIVEYCAPEPDNDPKQLRVATPGPNEIVVWYLVDAPAGSAFDGAEPVEFSVGEVNSEFRITGGTAGERLTMRGNANGNDPAIYGTWSFEVKIVNPVTGCESNIVGGYEATANELPMDPVADQQIVEYCAPEPDNDPKQLRVATPGPDETVVWYLVDAPAGSAFDGSEPVEFSAGEVNNEFRITGGAAGEKLTMRERANGNDPAIYGTWSFEVKIVNAVTGCESNTVDGYEATANEPPSDEFRPAGTFVTFPFTGNLDFDSDHEICPDNEATYGTQANTAGINTVEWMISGGGMILEGENARNVKVLWETPGVYTLSFEVTNNATGCTSSNSLEVTVLESPEVEIRRFRMNPFDEVCLGEEARFLASASAAGPPAVQTYDWSYTGGPAVTDYGQVAADGSTYRNQGAIYTAAGTEAVDLTVTYTNGCVQVAPTHNVEVIELPMDPVADQQIVEYCAPEPDTDPRQLRVATPGPDEEVVWYLVDAPAGSAFDGLEPVEFSAGEVNNEFRITGGTAGEKLTMRGRANGNDPAIYGTWSFEVKIVNTVTGCESNTVDGYEATANEPPSDEFRPAGTFVTFPFTGNLDFDSDHEICPDNEATYGTQANTAGINTVEWMISGGGMILEGENARNVKVLWETPGVYTLSFEVTNNATGCTSSNSLEVTVLESPEIEIRRFRMNPFDEVCLGEEARFLASASAAGPPAVQTYDWSYTGGPAVTDYGQVAADGSTYRNQGAIYTAAGTEAVDLTVTYTNGCVMIAPTHSIIVHDLPAVDVQPKDASVCQDDPLSYSGNPTGGALPYTHEWSDDGADNLDDKTIENPNYDTSLPGGPFPITYTVTDANGCSDSETTTVEVLENPEAPTIIKQSAEFCFGDPDVQIGGATNETGVRAGHPLVSSGSSTGRVIWILTAKPANSDLIVGNEYAIDCGRPGENFDDELFASWSGVIRTLSSAPVNNAGDEIVGTYTFDAYVENCLTSCVDDQNSTGEFSITILETPEAPVANEMNSEYCAPEPLNSERRISVQPAGSGSTVIWILTDAPSDSQFDGNEPLEFGPTTDNNEFRMTSFPDGRAVIPKANANGMGPGTPVYGTWFFDVKIVSADGCESSVETGYSFTSNPTPTISGDVMDVLCNGGSDGSIDITVGGGTPGYTYSWDNGSTDEDQTGLTAGTYCVTVTDANGCTVEDCYEVEEPPALNLSGDVMDVLCNGGSDGSIDITVGGGTPGYTYSWDNGSTDEDQTDLTAGTYCVTVTDANGCTIEDCYEVEEPPALTLSGDIMDVLCNGGSDGSIDITVGGGTPGYTYSWDNGSTDEDQTGLTAGTYCVTVTDANGCTIEDCYDVEEPPALTLSGDVTDVLCNGGSDGSIDITVGGGTPGYTYSWDNGSTDEDQTDLTAGTYCVTVTDANGCTIEDCYEVEEPPALTLSGDVMDVLCNGGSDGSIDITVGGGTPGYTYSWDNSSTDEDLTGLIAGTYCVTVTDANDCTIEDCFTVEEPDVLDAQASATDETGNDFEDGTATADPVGGTPPYSYFWSWLNQTTQTITDLPPGDYTVTVTDANGCVDIETVNVGEFICPDLLVESTQYDPLCHDSCDGELVVDAVRNSVEPLVYQWNTSWRDNTQQLRWVCEGIYQVTVTDAKNCSVVETYNVVAPEAISSNLILFHESGLDREDGEAEVDPEGGTPPYDIRWSNGDEGDFAVDLAPGVHGVEIEDANGCIYTEEFEILPYSCGNFTVESSVVNPRCADACDGRISIGEINGQVLLGNYDFFWSVSGRKDSIINLCEGQYIVTIVDENDCEYYEVFDIEAPEPLVAQATAVNESSMGAGDGSVQANAVGGTPPYQYEWSTGDNTPVVQNLSSGVYDLTITDAQSCQTVTSVEVGAFNCPNLVIVLVKQDLSCYNSCDGSASVGQVRGATPPLNYEWSTGSTDSSISEQCAGDYSVLVRDANNCFARMTFEIEEPEEIEFEVDSIREIQQETPGFIGIDIQDPVDYSFSWEYNGSLFSEAKDLDNVWVPGCYTLTITQLATGCSVEEVICIRAASIISTSVDESNLQESGWDVSYYPNPVVNQLQVEIRGISSEAEIQLFDLQGKLQQKLVLDHSTTSRKVGLDLGHLTAGMYILNVRVNEKVINKKVIVQK